jgi:hypothetical protein
MRVAILSCGALVVKEKEQSWLFGAPEGISEALDATGIEVPQVVFTTALRSPGFGKLGQVLRFKEMPLSMNGISAKPITHKHGTDYVIDADHARILFSERGDVSVEDTEGYNLAIIKNKHRADKFGEHVITWPWKDSEYLIQDNVTTQLSQKEGETWAKNESETAEKETVNQLLQILTQTFNEQFAALKKDNYSCYVNDADPLLQIAYVNHNGSNYGVPYDMLNGRVKFADEPEWTSVVSTWVPTDATVYPTMDYPPEGYAEDTYAYMEESLKEAKPGDHLVVEDKDKPSTWHLPYAKNGTPDPGLMGGAAAALTVGFRGNKYQGADRDKAIRKLVGVYNDLKKEVPENLHKAYEALKEYDLVDRIVKEGGSTFDIISIAVDKENPDKYYVNFGDWAEDATRNAVKNVIGESNLDSDDEAPPDETKYKIVWQESKRKEYVNDKPVPRIADIITAALHKAYNDTSDKLFQTGYLSQDERLKVAGSIGDGLDAFRKAIENEEFSGRAVDKWDADQLMQINKDTFVSVFKSKDDNTWRWATITSVAAWDKQGELFSTKAMDWAIGFSKMLTKMTDANARGPLRYKHIPGFDGGTCDTQLRIGDFLFEAGTFDDSKIGLAMRKKLKEDPAIWQISPGLAFAKHDLQGGVYQRAAIFERSMTQRPANPFTIMISKELDGEIEMKILTEQELKSAAEELGLEFEEAKMMYERALAAGSGPLGLKEFTEVVTKATGTNASGFPGGANSTHKRDDEDETEMLKQAVEELDESELKHLALLVESQYREKGELPPWLQKGGGKKKKAAADDTEDTADKTDPEDEEEMPMKKKKAVAVADETTEELKELIANQSNLILQQTKAMGELAAALAGGAQTQVQQAADNLFREYPRRQANAFVSSRTKSMGNDLPDDSLILSKLNKIEQQLKEQQEQQQNPGAGLYDQFTSTRLNQPKPTGRGVR